MASPTFDPNNIFLIMGHGSEIGDRRFVLNDNNYLIVPGKCGSAVLVNFEHLVDFFDTDYSNIEIPESNADLLNVERSIFAVGTSVTTFKDVRHKLYRPQYNRYNIAMSRYSSPDLAISFLIVRSIYENHPVIIDTKKYKLNAYNITISGIHRQTTDKLEISAEQDIPLPAPQKYAIPISKLRNKYKATNENISNRFTIDVYASPKTFARKINNYTHIIEFNLLNVIRASMEHSLLTFRELAILCWFAKYNKPLTVDKFIDVIKQIDDYELMEIYNEDEQRIELNKDEGGNEDRNTYEDIYIDTGELSINDLMHFTLRLSFLMELISKSYVDAGEPFLTYVSACRATKLSKEERREMAELSNTENFTHAAARALRLSRKKRPGGKSRFTRKAEKKHGMGEEE